MADLTRRQLLSAAARLAPATAVGGLVGSGLVGCSQVAPSPDWLPTDSSLALFAVGDTGRRSHGMGRWSTGGRVADAMTAMHRAHPADGLVLLGDNFYPDGLEKVTFAEQVRDCLVDPYRAFFEISEEGAERLGIPSACGDCLPVPVHAVLGNHDYSAPQSVDLQTRVLPVLLPNWRMPKEMAELREVGEGVSLILIQSVRWDDGVPEQVADCLARSKGPFRILAAHYPMADPGNNFQPTYTRDLQLLLSEANVPVHLFLGGHEHNLQILPMRPPAPPLCVIVGSGSRVREISPAPGERVYASDELGFGRIDVLPGEALVVTLWSVGRWLGLSPTLVARARVDLNGAVETWVAS
jgi:hypothetical protein